MQFTRSILLFYILLVLLVQDLRSEPNNSMNATSEEYNTNSICHRIAYVEHAHWTKEIFPNPQTDIEIDHCGRHCKPSWICDPEHLIDPTEAYQLDRKIEKIRQLEVCNSSNCVKRKDFYSISIGILSQLNVKNENITDIQQKTEEFANYLRLRKWKFSACDSDVVIFVLRNDNLIGISMGSVVRMVISTDCLENLRNETLNQLRQGVVGVALNQMILKFEKVLKTNICFFGDLTSPEHDGLPPEAIIAGIGIFIVLLGYGGFMLKSDMRRKRQVQRDKLKRHSSRKRKVSLALIKVRRQSAIKANAIKLGKVDANMKIIITNEDGIDTVTSDEEME